MNKSVLLVAILGVTMWAGCKKSAQNTNTPADIKSMNDVKVPKGFSWQSTRSITISASITDQRFGNSIYLISVYDGDPNAGGNLLASGSATQTVPYVNTLIVPATATQLYVVKTAPDKSKINSTINITGTTASISFSDKDPNVAQQGGGRSAEGGRTESVDCSSGCTNTITTSTNNVSVTTGNVICITGSNITVSFSSVNGGMIRVCGSNVTLQNCNLGGSAELLITSSGSANVSGLNFNSSSAEIDNEGTLTGNFSDGGIFLNNGTYTSTSDFNLNSSAGAFTNNGTMTVNGNFNNGAGVSPINAGSITVTGSFQQNSSSVAFINNCNLKVNGNYTQSGPVQNYNLINVLGTTTINSGTLTLYNGAMFQTANLMDNVTIVGSGATSLIKITGSITVNGGGGFNGALQVSCPSTIPSGDFSGGAAAGSSLYIATSSCNSIGNGTSTITDTDGDGVPDSLDAYPTDPTRAYNNYYPSSTGAGTVAFEDQWPSKGDFDMNDVVMGYQYNIVTNAQNKVAQVVAWYTLFATGGNNGNAFAVQFPTTSSSVSALTGGTLQTGQANAVVTVFTNMRSEESAWNTVPGATTCPAKTYTVTFNVSSGPAIATFGLSSFNPFIWSTAGNEIHLPGHLPTSTANTAIFGTADDNTSVSGGVYYVTKTGLPYAIDIPVSPFAYPVEGVDITQAYLHLAAWATSNGTTFADWYSNTASGYRNTANIYTH